MVGFNKMWGDFFGNKPMRGYDPLRGCTKIMTSLSWGGGRKSHKFNYNCIVKFVQKYDRGVCVGDAKFCVMSNLNNP